MFRVGRQCALVPSLDGYDMREAMKIARTRVVAETFPLFEHTVDWRFSNMSQRGKSFQKCAVEIDNT